MELLVALDAGTSSVRAIAFDAHGNVVDAAAREVPVVWGPARSGEMRGVRVDIAKARAMGFEPRVGLVDGLGLVWEDFNRP